MIARVDLAPLDGITKSVFRRIWEARFGGADRTFIPFFSPTPQHLLTPRDRREREARIAKLERELQDGGAPEITVQWQEELYENGV